VAPRRKVEVVRNGIDVARFATRGHADDVKRAMGIPPGARVIGTVGRLHEVKRQDRLIRGFARVAGTRDDVHLLLVGDGPLRDDLGRLADELGVGGRTHFAGYQAEPERFLGAMDVFALTSRSEGMPLSVLEAWAAGLPVVGSRVGGLPELIDDGRTGLLFDPEDEGALADVFAGLLDDPGRARGLGEAGRALVRERFDSRVMAEAYHRHYLRLLADPGARSGRLCRVRETQHPEAGPADGAFHAPYEDSGVTT
jgi:glycosyltransferase involved in cell wall biosynthesis